MKSLLLAISLFLILSTTPLQAGRVDINTADAQTLQENLEGVGEVRAKAIVNHRRKHGKFKSYEDLMQVPGIGEATINKNRSNLSLKGGISKSSKKTATSKTRSSDKKSSKSSTKTKTASSKTKSNAKPTKKTEKASTKKKSTKKTSDNSKKNSSK